MAGAFSVEDTAKYVKLVKKVLKELGNPKYVDRNALYDHLFPTELRGKSKPERDRTRLRYITHAMNKMPDYQKRAHHRNPCFERVTA